MFDFLKSNKDKPDTLPEKRFDKDRKEQITREVSKSDLNKGYNAYINCYQDYVDLVNQLDTTLSYEVNIDRLEADHTKQDIQNHIEYMEDAETIIIDQLQGEHEVEGHLYLVYLTKSKLQEMVKILDLYTDD